MAQLKDWQSGTSNDPYVVGSSGSLTLNQGTANGVAYLNGSKVVTSGSALTFDGTTFGTKLRATNTSGYKGVYMSKQSGRFIARITVNYKGVHLGCFKTIEEASQAYKKAALELHGSFARLE